ncbi:hypothetical protein B0H11DRAFT_1815615 [Mycena galericulata]|nr:hypothetical protein B0H11DRAFT_1815615 [Mycena galericulata]
MPLAHTTLVIIIAVAAAVGTPILLLVLYRVLRRPAQPAPLPPKQELARYRENHPNVPESRPQTWYDSGFLSASPSAFAASKSSLLPPDSRGGSPFRRPSLIMSESPSDDIPHLAAAVPMESVLRLPNLSFDTSSTSLSTAETGASTPDSPTPPKQSRSSSSVRPYRRSRPLSVGSASSSAISRNSRNTIRGVPHGPHSQVQIVLPAPLAFNDRISLYETPSRLSLVDQWAPMAVRSEMPRPQRRSFSSTEPRSLSQPPPLTSRRAASASAPSSPAAHHNRDFSSRLSPPPVPQIPQQWLPSSADPLTGIPEDSFGRGRSALTNDPPPQPVDRPPPPDGQRRLQKRSRSRGRS